MSKFASAFGEKYQSALNQIRTKSFTIGSYEFNVRVPLTAEVTALQERITKVDSEKVQARFEEMTKEIRTSPVNLSLIHI